MALITKDNFTYLDILKFEDSIPEIERLIEIHPFSKRIKFLLMNPELAEKPVKSLEYDELSPPNCLGTSFFVAGVSKLGYPYCACESELGQYMKKPIYDDIIPGVFNFSYCVMGDSWHSGIYLGNLKDEKLFFAQDGCGGDFCVESRANFSSPRYYMPKTLIKK